MGEAISEGRVFADAKARALLEVVRLAFEGGIGFDTEFPNPGHATSEADVEGPPNNGTWNVNLKSEKENAQNPAHPSHRPVSSGSSSRLVNGGPCMWCGITATPQWRRPRGTNKLLCNACGISFTRYGKLPEKNHQAHGFASQTAAATSMQSPSAVAPPQTSMVVPARYEVQQVPVEADPNQAESPDITSFRTAAFLDDNVLRYNKQGHGWLAQQSPQLHSQPQRTVWTGSSAVTIPNKRNEAPAPEGELLCGMDASSMDVDIEASPAPAAPAAVTAALPSQGTVAFEGFPAQQQQPMQMPAPPLAAASRADGPSASSSNDTATALAEIDPPASAALTVAPLELRLQKANQMQQLAPLVPSLARLGPAQQTCYFQGLTSAATASAAAGAAGATGRRSSTMDAGCGLGVAYPALSQPYGREHAASMSVLPFELLSKPFSLPVAWMPRGSAHAMAVPPPRSAYMMRPPKRQERLPAGESDDSNISTDSHAVTNGDAGISHDEDEGVAATTVSNTGITRESTALTAGDTAPALTVAWQGGLSCSPPAPPAGIHFQSIIHACPSAAVPSTALGFVSGSGDGTPLSLPPLAFGAVPVPAGLAGPVAVPALALALASSPARMLEQSPAILLETRRSKGPRNRSHHT